MSRLLFLFAIGLLVYLLVNSYRRNQSQSGSAPATKVAEDMVRCAHCGVHLPKGESIQSTEQFFCNEAHRKAFRG
jgi:uncharacterized protein